MTGVGKVTDFLITNDDGIQAKGIATLAEAVEGLGKYQVVAPDSNYSGYSHALTLKRPLYATQIKPSWQQLDGTPVDCVHLAMNGLLTTSPSCVLSGINRGPNLGDDALYSGTVAAALEGRHLAGISIGFSLASFQPVHWDSAKYVARRLVGGLSQLQLPQRTVLNVNIPDLPLAEIKGYKVTRLGHRHQAESIETLHDPRGNLCYWIGPAGIPADAGEGTDFYAVCEGFVSVTPLTVDMTHYDSMDSLQSWLGNQLDKEPLS